MLRGSVETGFDFKYRKTIFLLNYLNIYDVMKRNKNVFK